MYHWSGIQIRFSTIGKRFALLVTMTLMAALTTAPSVQAAIDKVKAQNEFVTVTSNNQGDNLRRNSGIIVDETGMILTSHRVVKGQSSISVILSGDDAFYKATLIAQDAARDLALLKIQKNLPAPAPFNEQDIAKGYPVHSISYAKSSPDLLVSDGTIAELTRAGSNNVPVFQHNAMIKRQGFGGALTNQCGEIVGMNRTDPDPGIFSNPAEQNPEQAVFATPTTVVIGFLRQNNIIPTVATDTCLTDAQRALAEAEQAKADALAAQQAAEEAEERARQLDEQNKAAEAARAKAKADAERAAQKAAEAEALAAQREAEAAAEQERRAQSEEQARELAKRNQEIEAAKNAEQAEQTKQRYILIGALCLLAIIGIIITLMLKRRANAANAEKETAEQDARAAQQAAARAESIAHEAMKMAPNLSLEGTDSGGKAIAIKISGRDIAQKENGVVVGRHPEISDVIIADGDISRAHFVVLFEDNVLKIADLDSTNGTILNDKALIAGVATELPDKATVKLGNMILKVSIG